MRDEVAAPLRVRSVVLGVALARADDIDAVDRQMLEMQPEPHGVRRPVAVRAQGGVGIAADGVVALRTDARDGARSAEFVEGVIKPAAERKRRRAQRRQVERDA